MINGVITKPVERAVYVNGVFWRMVSVPPEQGVYQIHVLHRVPSPSDEDYVPKGPIPTEAVPARLSADGTFRLDDDRFEVDPKEPCPRLTIRRRKEFIAS